jgi:hypothetical protein
MPPLAEGARVAPGVHRHGARLRAYFNMTVRVAGLGIVSKRFHKTFALDTPLDAIQQWQREEKARMRAAVGRPDGERRRQKPLSDRIAILKGEAERLALSLGDLERRVRAFELAAAQDRS